MVIAINTFVTLSSVWINSICSTGSNGSGGAASGPVSPDSSAAKFQLYWLTHLVGALLPVLAL
jgi:hypothetical protein